MPKPGQITISKVDFKMQRPSVYLYVDFRQFLRDMLDFHKKTISGFSMQTIADQAGFQSRSYVLNVISGVSTLSKSAANDVSQALQLKKKETEFFLILVDFGQCKLLNEKNELWEIIMEKRKRYLPVPSFNTTTSSYEYLRYWYVPALRELLPEVSLRLDLAKIGRLLTPHITVSQVKKGIKILTDLQLIHKTRSGWVQTSAHISVEDQMKNLAIRNFHSETADLATQSLQKLKSTDRDISTMTIGTTINGFHEIEQVLEKTRTEIQKIVEKENGVERVFQLNLHLFPISKHLSKEWTKK